MTPPGPADPSFWDEFVRQCWEQKPTVLRGAAAPILDSGESFRLLQRASEAFRTSRRAQVRFFVGHAQLVSDVGAHLPRAEEPLEAYLGRIEAALGGTPFGIVVNDAHLHDERLAERLRSFARPLFERVGLPGVPSHAVLFAGNYDTTPFRVHKDRASVFCFVIHGRKRMRVWPFQVFRQHATAGPGNPVVDAADYSAHLDPSEVLEGEPGDILYWPSSDWHTAESTGGFTASLSLSIADDPNEVARVLGEMTREWLEERLAQHRSGARAAAPLDDPSLPPSFRDALGLLGELDRALAARLERHWMDFVSGTSFHLPPPSPSPPLAPDDVIVASRSSPILWARRGDAFACSGHGASFEVPDHPLWPRLVETLNRGEPARVADLVRAFSGAAGAEPLSPERIVAFLEECHALGALRRAPR